MSGAGFAALGLYAVTAALSMREILSQRSDREGRVMVAVVVLVIMAGLCGGYAGSELQ